MKQFLGTTVLLALCLSVAYCLPFPSQEEEEPFLDTTLLDVDGSLTPIIQETKDLSEFFKLLTEMRSRKSLSIVGKDSKYIYLLVSDKTAQDEDDVVDMEVDESGRTKRSALLKKIGKGLDLIGPTGIRMIAVPISLFNFLGYLPMRLPGVPYHLDSGSPDDNVYSTVNHFYH